MKVVFLKWDSSLVLPVPKALAQALGAAEGKRADLTVENGALVVKVARPKKRRRYDLARLVDAITEENRHAEADWGAPRGNEVW